MIRGCLLAIVLACGLLAVDGGSPAMVQEQIDAVIPSLKKLKAAYARRVVEENDRLIVALESAMFREAEAGRAESAQALRDALAKARDGSLLEPYINPTMTDLLGDYFEHNCRSMVFETAKMDTWDPSLQVIPEFRMEGGYLRFHSGGGFEIRLPATGRLFLSLVSDVIPVDIGKLVFDESVVFAQHWSGVQALDATPVERLSIAINMTAGSYSLFANDRAFVLNAPIPVRTPKTIRFCDDGNPAYGSRIKSILVKSMMPEVKEEPSRF